jgi:hypothetical protein
MTWRDLPGPVAIGWLLGPLLIGFAAPASRAETAVPLAEPGSGAWKPLGFPKIERHTVYDVVRPGGDRAGDPSLPRAAFRARSECSASGLVLSLDDIDLRRTPRLAWRWKIERGLDIADERSKAGDDFAARVYVMFRFDKAAASLWERLRHRLARAIYGDEIPGRALNYVWASRAPPGSDWPNPYSAEAHMLVLRSGSTGAGEWQRELVDLLADHRRLLGEPRTPALSLALMSDSDNTCARTTAYFADFRLLGAEDGAAPTSPASPSPAPAAAPAAGSR